MQLQSVRFKEPVAGPGKGQSTSQGFYAGEPPPGASVNSYTWMKSIELARGEVVLTSKAGRIRRSPINNLIEYEAVGDHLDDAERENEKEKSK